MKNKKFWNWKNQETTEPDAERVLELYGTIAEESWWEDDVTPKMFRDELFAGSGPVTIWINSPGGDCVAASQIYSMLMDYKDSVTVKIDGIAASAASVIAMAGTKVLMAPTALLMIHNPMTLAIGDIEEMQKAIANIVDVNVIGDGSVLRTAVIFFYLSNEGISMLENATHLGLPIPEKLKEVLEKLHDRSGKDSE